jgi:tRNA pseudouridine38-40 synthase
MNFKLLIEYDGSAYCGWQRQRSGPTVQGEIEHALATIAGRQVSVAGSGRTDAGVHALGQVASFRLETRLAPEALRLGLNSLTPADIVVRACSAASDGFHARYSALGKTYRYRILNRSIPSAVGRQYAWFIHRPLALEPMREALRHMEGTHDFKAFEGVGSPRANTTRHVSAASLAPEGDGTLTLEITGNGFLKHMVRNIVGTLVWVGLGKLSAGAVAGIIAGRDRRAAGPTAPAHGLFLWHVLYPPEQGTADTGSFTPWPCSPGR